MSMKQLLKLNARKRTIFKLAARNELMKANNIYI